MKLGIGLLGLMACVALAVAGGVTYRDHVDAARPVAHVRTAPTGAGYASPAPVTGVYWVCETDVNASGAVETSRDAGIEAEGGIPSSVCASALRIEGVLKPDSRAHAFQVPVGHFTPFHFCGVTVANIVNVVPGSIEVPPSRWIAADYELYSADWSQSAPSGTC
ncbi:MAG: hypothetical protein J2P57_15070 [Acidimicrobiaceae bacterium]|nr:hypothetical protein [Acidimicrobiaceae bacterium]